MEDTTSTETEDSTEEGHTENDHIGRARVRKALSDDGVGVLPLPPIRRRAFSA